MAIISNGTTIADAGSFASGLVNADQVLIKTLTASSSSTLSFLNGSNSVVFDGTYPIYVFKFIDIHPATDGALFSFQADTGTNTSYNQTITSTFFTSIGSEDGSEGSVSYQAGDDQAQGTAFQQITNNVGNANDESLAGTLFLYNPSSTTFVKHFMCNTNEYNATVVSLNYFTAGYFNTTSAINAVQFKFDSGNTADNYTFSNVRRWESRFVYLSFNYNFGKQIKGKQRRRGKNNSSGDDFNAPDMQ